MTLPCVATKGNPLALRCCTTKMAGLQSEVPARRIGHNGRLYVQYREINGSSIATSNPEAIRRASILSLLLYAAGSFVNTFASVSSSRVRRTSTLFFKHHLISRNIIIMPNPPTPNPRESQRLSKRQMDQAMDLSSSLLVEGIGRIPKNSTPEQRAAIMAQAEQKAVNRIMTVMMARMFKHCFDKCAGTSGDGLTYEEESCLAKCQDRFVDVRKVVQDTLHDGGFGMESQSLIVSDEDNN
jgi:hypothetical protein